MKISTLLFLLFISIGIQAQTDCLSVNANILNVSCEGANDGAIILEISGTPPYTYLWNTGATTSFINDLETGHYQVTVTDSLGCTVMVGEEVDLSTAFALEDGDTTILVKEVFWFGEEELIAAGDMIEVCIIMEHTWMRDLNIKFRCPDGTSILLHNYEGQLGNRVLLGQPIPDEVGPEAGIGFKYCWTSEAEDTWNEAAPLDIVDGFVLPAGDYAAEEPFDGFVGCPKNGIWELEIADLWLEDNGFFFDGYVSINGAANRMTIGQGVAGCVACEEEYYCMDWLRDTVRNNILNPGVDYFSTLAMAQWGGRTIFAASFASAIDANFVSYYDCNGVQFLNNNGFFAYPFADNIFFTTDEITDILILWTASGDPAIPFEDCGALIVEDFPLVTFDCFGDMGEEMCARVEGGFAPYEYFWDYVGETAGETACLTPNATGTYALYITDLNGTVIGPINMQVNGPEEMIIDVQFETDSLGNNCLPVIEVSGGTPPYSIDWDFDETTGMGTTVVEDVNGCSSEVITACIIEGLDDISTWANVAIFPNPASDALTIFAELPSSNHTEVSIRNITGQVVLFETYQTRNLKVTLNLSAISSGVYFVEIKQGGKQLIRKLVVQE